MKKFLVFLALLGSKALFACGFYPYGEELRFCLFSPYNFDFGHYSGFNYSSAFFSPPDSLYGKNENTPNEDLWVAFCKNKVPAADIRKVLNEFYLVDIDPLSTNEMIKYLYKTKNLEAIEYLKFAKRCEYFTTETSDGDSWERNESQKSTAMNKLIQEGIKNADAIKNKELRLRYHFLAMRLAYYNNDSATINGLFDSSFKNLKNKNILYYYGLYFKSIAESNKVLGRFYAIQVYANCPEKRFVVYNQFDKSLPISAVLKYAKNKQEINNVTVFYAIRNPSKSLDAISEIYQRDSKAEGLNFLMMREMNKIDDWVFTPYYTLFHPSMEDNWNYETTEYSISAILKRIQSDRLYAAKVLNFVNGVDLSKVNDAIFWKSCKAHLLFVTQNYSESLAVINQIEKEDSKKEAVYNQLQIIKALSLAASQQYGKAIITNTIKPILLKNKDNKQFLFAIGRELEMKGNSTDAALLFSKLNDEKEEMKYQFDVFWKTKKSLKGSYQDYFNNYFDYVDRMYKPSQLEDLINDIEINSTATDSFSVWKYSLLRKQKSNLFDLLGTMYIRQNKLEKAAASFEKVEKDYWISYYDCLWERKRSNGLVFDSNPFFEFKWSPDFIKKKEGFQLNKLTVTQHLIQYLNKANNPKEKNRDYYYFLVANCYYNMSEYGNSWMMRRYGISNYDVEPFPEDEEEFRESNFSDYYYDQAAKYAKTPEFKALCLRLGNQFGKLKKEFPDDYYPLCSGCTAFEDYYNSRI